MLSSSRLTLGHLATLQRLRSCLLAAVVSLGANSFQSSLQRHRFLGVKGNKVIVIITKETLPVDMLLNARVICSASKRPKLMDMTRRWRSNRQWTP